MTTGTGIALFGMWLTAAACWHSKMGLGATAFVVTLIAFGMTVWLA